MSGNGVSESLIGRIVDAAVGQEPAVPNHTSSMDAEVVFKKRLAKATVSDHWMAAAWKVEGDKLTFCGVTTYDFPVVDFDESVAMMAKELSRIARESSSNPPEPEPLPEALPEE